MNKRGMSAIASTFILILVAVALGVIVMNWGRATLEENSRCAINTGMSILKLNEEPQVCYAKSNDGGVIHFIVENGKKTEIEKVKMRVIGKKGVFDIDVPESNIDIEGSIIKDIPYNFNTFGDIHQIRFTPMLVLYPQDPALECSEQTVIVENIKACK